MGYVALEKSMNRRSYWQEAVGSSFGEAGIEATMQQIDDVAGDMEISHENYGMASGGVVASDNLRAARAAELKELQTKAREATETSLRLTGELSDASAARDRFMYERDRLQDELREALKNA